MKGHEYLPGRDDFGEPQFDAANAAAARYDVDAVVAAQAEAGAHRADSFRATHAATGVRESAPRGLGAGVPVLHGAARVQDEWILRFGCSGNGSHSAHTSFALPSGGLKLPSL